jgi:CO/xanthine dehydrogenase Mo-binding subunit/aerobic-type carbon monoxide dehydrogenase small subunit (CoxS/CutS family)
MSTKRHSDDSPASQVRRAFLRDTATATVGAGLAVPELLTGAQASPAAEQGNPVQLTVNGKRYPLRVPDHRTLLLVLREDLGLTGTKKGCNRGQCGACTVLLDGDPVYACMLLAADAVGHEVVTIEGLERDGRLHPLQQAFIERMGSQCGHCTPGMILSATALLRDTPDPTPEQVREALSGNLCRCGNYGNEIAAVLDAARRMSNPWQPAGATEPVHAPRSPAVRVHKSDRPPAPPGLDARLPSLDAYAKATGRARYTGDLGLHRDDEVRRPLIAKLLRCPYPHAEALRVDDRLARELPGYRGLLTWDEVPESPGDRRCLNRVARYVGDAVAAVAAEDQYTAQESLQRLQVEWRHLPAHPDPQANLERDLRAIHSGGPVAGFAGPQPAGQPSMEFVQGDLEAGLAGADLIVEGRYETPAHCHAPSEPHCCIADLRDGKLTVWDSQQSIFHAREVLSRVLHLAPESIRVVCEYLGGGFGGKCLDTPGKTLYQAVAALLSAKTGRPVRLEYTLEEALAAEDVRHPFIFEIRAGVTNDGRLTALDCRAIAATGGYASSGPAVVSVAGEGIIDTYNCPAYRYRGYAVYTNGPVGGEFRGFGHPQAVFARERHMDAVAARLGLDPLELRRRNSKRTGDLVTLGVAKDVPLQAIAAHRCMEQGAKAIGWDRWLPPGAKSGRLRRGLGMRVSQEHSGRNDSDALAWLDRQGRVHLPLGVGNLGTHAATGIAVMVAQVLGLPVEAIDTRWGDTERVAWDFVTDASRSVHCTGKAAYNAALDLAGQLKALAAPILGEPAARLTLAAGRVSAPGGGSVSLRRLAADALPRGDLTPRYDPQTDRNPLLDENTGIITAAPPMRLHSATERLARALLRRGGLVGLGYYVFHPGVQPWGASFAEVEVDMETGQVEVLQLVCAHDIGRVIYRPGAEAQVLGGTIMGLGYAQREVLHSDPRDLAPVNPTLYGLGIPGMLDYPLIHSILVEAPAESGPFGAKGLGENPMWNAAAAIGNAIYNATGTAIDRLPYDWANVYAALHPRRSSRLSVDN